MLFPAGIMGRFFVEMISTPAIWQDHKKPNAMDPITELLILLGIIDEDTGAI
ncbi:MAG: hypothetical protein R3330_00425 [Saprospiraceae bacterium]|nr:hypothetical protein [Saprospiraceae bacterium]